MRCLSCLAAVVALLASAHGVRQRAGRPFAIAGLMLAVPAALLWTAADPGLMTTFAVIAVAVGFAVTQWREP